MRQSVKIAGILLLAAQGLLYAASMPPVVRGERTISSTTRTRH